MEMPVCYVIVISITSVILFGLFFVLTYVWIRTFSEDKKRSKKPTMLPPIGSNHNPPAILWRDIVNDNEKASKAEETCRECFVGWHVSLKELMYENAKYPTHKNSTEFLYPEDSVRISFDFCPECGRKIDWEAMRERRENNFLQKGDRDDNKN